MLYMGVYCYYYYYYYYYYYCYSCGFDAFVTDALVCSVC